MDKTQSQTLVFISIIILGLITSCSKQASEDLKLFEDLYYNSFNIELPDTLGARLHIRSVLALDDSIIYFSERMTSGYYKLDKKQNKITLLTKYGMGPGEFKMPMTIVKHKKHLFLSGASKPVISKFSFSGKYISDIKMPTTFGAKTFIMNQEQIYKLNSGNNYYFKDLKNNLDLVEYPICFKNPSISFPPPGAFVYKDTLYYMNNFEPKIFKNHVNNFNNTKSLLLQDLGGRKWNYNQKIRGFELSNLMKDQFSVIAFREININNKIYFYVHGYWVKNEEKIPESYIYTLNGKKHINLSNKGWEKIIYSDYNRVIFLNMDWEIGKTTLTEYKLSIK